MVELFLFSLIYSFRFKKFIFKKKFVSKDIYFIFLIHIWYVSFNKCENLKHTSETERVLYIYGKLYSWTFEDSSNVDISEQVYTDFLLLLLTQTTSAYAINCKEKVARYVCAMDVWIVVCFYYLHSWSASYVLVYVRKKMTWSSRPGASQGSEAFGDGSAVVSAVHALQFTRSLFLYPISLFNWSCQFISL